MGTLSIVATDLCQTVGFNLSIISNIDCTITIIISNSQVHRGYLRIFTININRSLTP